MKSAMIPWGWDEGWQAAAEATGVFNFEEGGFVAARVVCHVHHTYDVVVAPDGHTCSTGISGAFTFRAAGPEDYPTVGDWVLLDGDCGRIQFVLPRRSAICRGIAGRESRAQVITANVDVLLLVFGLDGGRNFTVGMLERSLVTAWNSGARPVIVLNKTDCADPDRIDTVTAEARAHAPHESIHPVSAITGDGIRELLREIPSGTTAGMLGKSGVGKSALINAFVRTSGASRPHASSAVPAPAREGRLRAGDLQGRHTTSHKRMYRLPSGQLVVDVPGLRELQLWGDETDLDSTFADVEILAAECRFRDCSHQGEPGCRVAGALETGELPADRYERYLDYRRELAYLHRRRDERARAEERDKGKKIAGLAREIRKNRR